MKVPSFFLAIFCLGAALPAQAQVVVGEKLFKQRCAMCHNVTAGGEHGIGPNLHGVVGRMAASTSFSYSSGLKKAGLKWDQKTLDTFLIAPGRLAPGTLMVVSVPNTEERTAIIVFLAKQK